MADTVIHADGVAGGAGQADGDALSGRPPFSEKSPEMEPPQADDNARLEQVLQSDVRSEGET